MVYCNVCALAVDGRLMELLEGVTDELSAICFSSSVVDDVILSRMLEIVAPDDDINYVAKLFDVLVVSCSCFRDYSSRTRNVRRSSVIVLSN